MKSGKVKNPCKICFQSVNKKNGLQCGGACKKWAHYKCLNYTPGKIKDIKAGIVKITCPCPDCVIMQPKELQTNTPYTCTNQECPATKLPSCESTNCPSKQKPIPFQPIPHTREYSTPLSKYPAPPISKPARPSSPTSRTLPAERATSPTRPAVPTKRLVSCPSCPMHCPKRPKNVADKKSSSINQRSNSCSFTSTKSSDSDNRTAGPRATLSDNDLSSTQMHQKNIFCTIEEMCRTMGELSNQIKELMCKMTTAFEENNLHRN